MVRLVVGSHATELVEAWKGGGPAGRHYFTFFKNIRIIHFQSRKIGVKPSGDVVDSRESDWVVGIPPRSCHPEISSQYVPRFHGMGSFIVAL